MNIQDKAKDEFIVEIRQTSFSDIFNLVDLQHLQDLFAEAHGVASIITDTEGNPITRPSNFTRLCDNIIRKTEKGRTNCFLSDKVIGRHNPSGPIVQTCLSCGLWDAGASINIGGLHIANWLIGQVRSNQVDEQKMMLYADEIGANKEDFIAALNEVPVMQGEQLKKIADLLFVFANELSEKAYSNMQLKRQIAEKEKALVQLLEQEENLSTTLHSIGDGVIATDKNGLIIQMNPVAETLCGWKLAEASGKPLNEVFRIINSETRNAVADPVARVFEKGEIVGLANHTVLISKNGTEYQIADSAAPIMNKGGEITGVVLVFSNVTEKYETQKQIKTNEERYRSILNNLEAGIVVHAPDTSIMMNNARASELLGLSNDQMQGKAAIDPAWKFTHEDNTPLTLDEYPISIIVNSRQSIKNHVLGIHHPGKNDVVWVTVNGFPVLDTKGEITEVVISFIDITDRMHSEAKIKLSEEKFSKSFFNSPDSIIINRLDNGKIVTVNNGFRKIMGYEEADVIGKTTTELNFYKNPEERNAIIHALKTTGQALDIECWFITKHGEEKLGLLSAALIDIDGVKHIMSTSRDVTERKQMEEALKNRENLLNKVFDLLPVGLWFADAKGRLIRGNPAGVKIWGAEPTVPIEEYGVFKARRHPAGVEIGPDDWALAHTIREGVTITDEQLEIDAFDGHKKIILNYTAPVLDDQGNILGAIVVNHDITERKNAEEALIRSEKELKKAQQITHIGSWFLDVATNQVVWTEELYKMYGFDPALPPPLYTEHQKLFTPESWELLSSSLAKTRETGIPYELELKTVREDGSNGWMWVRGETILDNKGHAVGLWGAAQDITERKQSREDLKKAKEQAEESEQYFRNIFENSPVGKSITSLDGSIKTNKAFRSMLGYSFDELQTKNIIEITHPDDIQITTEAIKSMLNGEKSQIQFEKRYIHKNGSVVYANVVAALQKNRDGEPLFFITSANDITERKQSEKALIESEQRFKNMFERHSSIMLLIEPESGMIIGANEASAKFYGYSKAELLTMRIDDINMLNPDQVKSERDDAVLEKRSFFIFPHRLANGDVRTVEVHSSPIVFQDQKILFSVIHDITERKKLEKIREIQYDIATAVVTSGNLGQLLEFVRTRLSELFDTTNFFAARYNAQNNTLKKMHWVDEVDDFEEWDAAISFSGYVVQTGKTLLLNKQEIGILAAEQNIPITGTPAECWLGVPLVVDKKTIGVLVIQSYTDPKAYDSSSAMLFELIAHDLSVFIEKTTILQHLSFAIKQAEESEEKFRTLSENSPAIIYRILLQPKPAFDYVGPIVTQITGYTPEEIYADFNVIYKIIHPEDRMIYETAKQKTHGEPSVLRFIRKDGKIIWVEQRLVTLYDKAGNPFAVEGIATDITAQKEADAALAFQGNMLSQISEAVIATDLEGAITFWNNSAEKLYGWKAEEVIGKNIIDIAPTEATKEQAVEIFNSLAEGKNWMGEFMVKNKEGHSFPVTVNDSPMFDSKHNLIGIIGVSFDITERKKIENEVRLLNETLEQRVAERTNELIVINKELEFHLSELEQFSYVSNHDLQEPLRALSQITQLFNEKYAGKLDEEGNKYVDFIIKSAIRMKALVKDLLDYSLLGKESVKTTVDCNEIVDAVLSDLDDSIKGSNAIITIQELPVFTGYETEMRQLFQNLIGNAIKYQKQDNRPEIHISAESHDKEWLFSIKDNGIGIDQKHFDKIFIIFQRLHNRNEYAGTGIGLANCKKVVGLHGGKIWVESKPGAGSIFKFTIPKK